MSKIDWLLYAGNPLAPLCRKMTAVNGVGRSPRHAVPQLNTDGGGSVTVPGMVAAWQVLADRWGRLPLSQVLEPAIRHAKEGIEVTPSLAAAVERQRPRLIRGGAGKWALLHASPGEVIVQERLAQILALIGAKGAAAYYRGELASAIAAAAQRDGGQLSTRDLADHHVSTCEPISVKWDTGTVFVQPPPSQGVLLAMALRWLDKNGLPSPELLDHVGIEITEEVFKYRDRCARDGASLLDETLRVNFVHASRQGGPRAYLHTAGVAIADSRGLVISSLVSIFDDFGAGTFVREGEFVLNNRAAGFTAAPNDVGPAKQPVHTLAPAMIVQPEYVLALATPGADGQVQTLLQVLSLMRYRHMSLHEAIAAPRWRSEGGLVLVGATHVSVAELSKCGHDVAVVDDGDPRFGAVVGAGISAQSGGDRTIAAGDWRRQVHAAAI
ncbi:MAG: gamma-glutamyltransferase [Stellaceae bacterium]